MTPVNSLVEVEESQFAVCHVFAFTIVWSFYFSTRNVWTTVLHTC